MKHTKLYFSFCRFPKDEARRKVWENKMRRKDFKVTDHTYICSKHFTADNFDKTKFGGTWLKKDAMPTIFEFSEKHDKPRRKRKLSTEENVDNSREGKILNSINLRKIAIQNSIIKKIY